MGPVQGQVPRHAVRRGDCCGGQGCCEADAAGRGGPAHRPRGAALRVHRPPGGAEGCGHHARGHPQAAGGGARRAGCGAGHWQEEDGEGGGEARGCAAQRRGRGEVLLPAGALHHRGCRLLDGAFPLRAVRPHPAPRYAVRDGAGGVLHRRPRGHGEGGRDGLPHGRDGPRRPPGRRRGGDGGDVRARRGGVWHGGVHRHVHGVHRAGPLLDQACAEVGGHPRGDDGPHGGDGCEEGGGEGADGARRVSSSSARGRGASAAPRFHLA
mmetsp:Transcript_11386/g.39596  ORF Transcript_11386/g.39596 Transcript_11386/m.39596 type:complete len:267 (-) Transcript_11386:52-852(-)